MNIRESIEPALAAFEQISCIADAKAIAPVFLATSHAAIAARDPRFAHGMERLTARIIQNEDSERHFGLALAWRLTSVTAMRDHRRKLIDALDSPVPAFEELPTV